jgi:hypothetical protein
MINFTAVSLNGMTTTTFNYLKNVTSDVQTQLNNIVTNANNLYYGIQNIFTQNNTFTGFTTINFTTLKNNISSTTLFSYLSGVSSNIQTQLNSSFTQTNIFTGSNTFKNAITFGNSNFIKCILLYILCSRM